jgi:hypothetical protein
MTNSAPDDFAPEWEVTPSAFFSFVDRFLAGTNDADVARESISLVKSLPKPVIPTCLLIGIITFHRIGEVAVAHKIVRVLNKFATGWDLPGIPITGVDRLQKLTKLRGQIDDRQLDWALLEHSDVKPILDVLRAMQLSATKSENDALLSLIRQYEVRQADIQKKPN